MILSSSSFSSLAHALIEESKLIRLPIQQTVPFSPFSGEKESRVKGIQGVEFLPSFYSVLSKREITRQFLFRTYSKKKRKKGEKETTIPRHFDMVFNGDTLQWNEWIDE